jgi:hypothetical protein
LVGQGSGYGVWGQNTASGKTSGAGMWGVGARSDGYGVGGQNLTLNGTAVFGQSNSGNGVLGQIRSLSNANGVAVYGLNVSTYAGPGPGAGGFGVYGLSAKGHGLVGAVASAGAAAVVGATNGVAGAYAGVLWTRCGQWQPHGLRRQERRSAPPDGTHRRLCCVESPESWFEDFGKGQLDCGFADVTIDPDFAAVAELDDYHVFLTSYDNPNDLYVKGRSAAGFRVESRNVASTDRFSWRIVAKRKDISAPQFETVTVPPEPVLPPIPEMVDAPRPPFPPRVSARHAENARR